MAFWLALVLCAVAGCGGCGGEHATPQNQKWAEDQAALRKKAEEEDILAEKLARAAAEQRRLNSGAAAQPVKKSASASVAPTPSLQPTNPVAATSPPPAAPTPPLAATSSSQPGDLATWRMPELLAAIREKNPKLIDAIRYLGESASRGTNTADNIVMLTFVLDTAAKESANAVTEDEDRPRRGTTSLQIGQVTMEALATIGTSAARQPIYRLVTAKVANQALAQAALKLVLQWPSAETDDVVLKLAIQAGQRRGPESRDAILRELALKYVREHASEELRVQLAKLALRPETTDAAFNDIWECLREQRADNLAAQTVLYQGRRLDGKSVEALEAWLATNSREALAAALRVPDGGAQAGTSIDPARAAECLWNHNLSATVEQRLRLQENVNQGLPLLTLATTLPSPTIRDALRQVMEKHWEDGPKPLNILGNSDGLFDPGLRLTIRQLLPKTNGRVPISGSNSKALAAAREFRQRQEELAKQWKTWNETLVRSMCQRFYRLARAQRVEPGTSNLETLSSRLGLKLRPETRLLVSHFVEWPEGVDQKFENLRLPPLRLCYARVEHKAQPAKLLAYYRRQVPSCEQHLNEHGAWLEGAKKDTEGRYIESIDVLVSKSSKETAIMIDQEQPLTVEILMIQCGRESDGSLSAGSSGHDSRGS